MELEFAHFLFNYARNVPDQGARPLKIEILNIEICIIFFVVDSKNQKKQL